MKSSCSSSLPGKKRFVTLRELPRLSFSLARDVNPISLTYYRGSAMYGFEMRWSGSGSA